MTERKNNIRGQWRASSEEPGLKQPGSKTVFECRDIIAACNGRQASIFTFPFANVNALIAISLPPITLKNWHDDISGQQAAK